MQAYLAEKYMSGPKADAILARTAPKKKKRKVAHNTTSGPSMFVDEDAGFGDEVSRQQQEDELDLTEAAVASDRTFKKRNTGWTTVQEGVKRERSPSIPPDEQPTVVEDVQPFKGGLIRSEDLRKVSPFDDGMAWRLTPPVVAIQEPHQAGRDGDGRGANRTGDCVP